MFSLATIMQIFTKDVKSLTEKYQSKRDNLDQSYIKRLGARLKLNSAAIEGITKVEAQCAKEKKALVKENQAATTILQGIKDGN